VLTCEPSDERRGELWREEGRLASAKYLLESIGVVHAGSSAVHSLQNFPWDFEFCEWHFTISKTEIQNSTVQYSARSRAQGGPNERFGCWL
jgi:hypothetical protein